VVLSHDTSSCSCTFVALPPPSDDVPALWCVSTPVMRAAVYLLHVSAAQHRRVAVLLVRPLRQSLAVCSCCVVIVVLCAAHLFSRAWYRCGRVVTCVTVAVSLACRVG
jgi:hypothetical protein